MTVKPSKYFQILHAVVIGIILMAIGYSTSWANSMESDGHKSACAAQQHGSIDNRLDKIEERLEIKASQQAVWAAYAKAYRALADRHVKTPDRNADAATSARYRAEVVADLAKKLARVADTTAKLQAVLSPEQRNIFNRVTRHLHHGEHEWRHQQSHEGNREWSHHNDSGHEEHPDDQGMEEPGNDKPMKKTKITYKFL